MMFNKTSSLVPTKDISKQAFASHFLQANEGFDLIGPAKDLVVLLWALKDLTPMGRLGCKTSRDVKPGVRGTVGFDSIEEFLLWVRVLSFLASVQPRVTQGYRDIPSAELSPATFRATVKRLVVLEVGEHGPSSNSCRSRLQGDLQSPPFWWCLSVFVQPEMATGLFDLSAVPGLARWYTVCLPFWVELLSVCPQEVQI